MKSAGFLNRIRNLSSIFTQLFNTIQKILKVIFQARSQKTKIKWSLDNQSKLQSIENSSEFHKLFQAFEHCSLSQKLVGTPCYVRHSFIFPNEWVCRRVYICRRVSSSNPRFALLSPVCLTYWSKWLLCERLQHLAASAMETAEGSRSHGQLSTTERGEPGWPAAAATPKVAIPWF